MLSARRLILKAFFLKNNRIQDTQQKLSAENSWIFFLMFVWKKLTFWNASLFGTINKSLLGNILSPSSNPKSGKNRPKKVSPQKLVIFPEEEIIFSLLFFGLFTFSRFQLKEKRGGAKKGRSEKILSLPKFKKMNFWNLYFEYLTFKGHFWKNSNFSLA